MDDAPMGPVGAQWESLPAEVADQIGWELGRCVFWPPYDTMDQTSIQYALDLRWLCAAFARGLRLHMYILTHRTHPNHVEHLTEGLLRMTYAVEPRREERRWKHDVAIHKYAYTAVYNGCTRKRPTLEAPFYDTLRMMLVRLLREGAIQWKEHDKNLELWVMAAYYKYLDRFYVRRLCLTPVFEMLQETYRANRPTEA